MFSKLLSTRRQQLRLVHIEIGFFLSNIEKWVLDGCKGDLLDPQELKNRKSWEFDDSLIFKVDIVPTHSGTRCLYFHQSKNKFSEVLDGSVWLQDALGKKYPNIGVLSWEMAGGELGITISTEHGDKDVLVAPIDKIAQVQLGQFPDEDEYNAAAEGSDATFDQYELERDEERIIEVPVSKKKKQKVCEAYLGIRGKGVGYRNTLCFVKAYPPVRRETYDIYEMPSK